MYVGRFDPDATPTEKRVIGFDFAPRLPAGIVVSSAVLTCVEDEDSDETDATASARLTGSVVIDAVTQAKVTQVFEAGVDGCLYMIHCLATCSDGRKLEMSGNLLCFKPK